MKRGKLKDPVDIQALRYASYIAKWRFEDFEEQARAYLTNEGAGEFNFNSVYEQFCTEAGADEAPDINADERIILVGSEVQDKLGSVALWLTDHNLDIKVIQVEVYKEGENILLQPRTIVPLPVSRFERVGERSTTGVGRLWVTDGQKWHLEKRCGPITRGMLLKLDEIITTNLDVDAPRWSQKFYLAYRVGSFDSAPMEVVHWSQRVRGNPRQAVTGQKQTFAEKEKPKD